MWARPSLIGENALGMSLKPFGNSWGNLYTKFAILDIKFCFTCGESELYWNIAKFPNIMTRIEGPNNGLHFLLLALNFVHKWYSQNWHCSSLRQFTSIQNHSSKTRLIRAPNFVLLKVRNSGNNWIQVRSRKPGFEGVSKKF